MAKSYKDPLYDQLDADTTARLGLPDGLLAAIRTRGERSNADQVSDAGAKTVYQFIPDTREAVIKKYKIDPWLSPENASLAAGYLLKESLERNKGDAAAAVGEYIGGTDRANWGRTTRAYINRVMTGLAPAVRGRPLEQTGRRLSQELADQQAAAPSISKVFDAYKSGAMSPDEAAEFEADVQAGRVLLPRGAEIKKPEGAADPIQGVLSAYYDGRMTPDEKAEFESDVAAGRVKLPEGVQLQAGGTLAGSARASQIPGQDGQPVVQAAQPEPTIGEKLVGTGEAALTTLTGLTGGTVGMVGGTAKGLAQAVMNGEFGTPEGARTVEQAAAEGADALTYTPRTRSGQEQAAAVGELMQQTLPVLPLAGEMAALSRAGQSAAQPVAAAGRAATQGARAAVQQGAERAAQAVRRQPEPALPTPGTMGSVGAAGTDIATIRRTEAQGLPVPIDLTKGQATRGFEQLRFEQEMAKDPLKGNPLRERFADQNQAMLRNFDVWVDDTGAQLTDARAVGDAVTGALRERAAADKNRIRAAYKEAEKAGEMEAPVVLDEAVRYINENAPDAAVAPVLDAMRARAVRLGVATMGADGELVPQAVPLKTAELFRRAISNATDAEPTNIRHATLVKKLVDGATEGEGGTLYKQARGLRARYAQNYENIGLVYDLMNTKRGTTDARVAAEDVFRRSVLNSSFQDVRQLRRILQTGGDGGQQAWRELQGAAVRWIRDQATDNVSRDSRGNEIVSAAKLHRAISQLDQSGKLDFMFGKQGAEQMRAINELAKVVYTAPPGVINTSNTASVILAALDIATSGIAGMPLPVASGLRILTTHVKDRKIQKRINEALGLQPEAKPKVKAPQSVLPPSITTPQPASRTIH